jgi:hypothetical protein
LAAPLFSNGISFSLPNYICMDILECHKGKQTNNSGAHGPFERHWGSCQASRIGGMLKFPIEGVFTWAGGEIHESADDDQGHAPW